MWSCRSGCADAGLQELKALLRQCSHPLYLVVIGFDSSALTDGRRHLAALASCDKASGICCVYCFFGFCLAFFFECRSIRCNPFISLLRVLSLRCCRSASSAALTIFCMQFLWMRRSCAISVLSSRQPTRGVTIGMTCMQPHVKVSDACFYYLASGVQLLAKALVTVHSGGCGLA